MPSKIYYLYSETAAEALDAIDRNVGEVTISADLNISTNTFPIRQQRLVFDDNNSVGTDDLKTIAGKDKRVFCIRDGRLEILESRQDGYHKLVPTSSAPYLETSGVKMHISKGTCPFGNAVKTTALAVKRGDRVLDTCGGLGYTVIAALKHGARKVVSVEINPVVISLREMNPWSVQLADSRIQTVNADIGDYIGKLEDESFDSIIHDPPRFSLAGDLYGEDFYRELFRVLKKKGTLFHYTGNPGIVKRGKNFTGNTAKRLGFAGFRKITPTRKFMGLTAVR